MLEGQVQQLLQSASPPQGATIPSVAEIAQQVQQHLMATGNMPQSLGNTSRCIAASRVFSHLSSFSDKSQNFRKWTQAVEAVVDQVWGKKGVDWLAAAKNKGPESLPKETLGGEEYASFAKDLWLALLFKVDGQAWAFTLTMGGGRGCELWRALQHEYDPVTPEHAVVLEQQLMQL